MPKLSYIYFLIAIVPIGILTVSVYKSLSPKDFESPVIFSNISKSVEQILTVNPLDNPALVDSKSIKIGETDDPKAMGYTGQDKIAVNSKGEIFVAYRSKTDDNFEIFVSKVKGGKLEFSKAITDSGEDIIQRVPSIAIDASDVIHVTWYGLTPNESEGRQIKYAKSTNNGKNWSEAVIPSLVEGYKDNDYWQEHPQILVKGNNLYIVWEGKDEKNEEQQVKFAKSTNGGKTWSQWKNVQPGEENTQSRPYLIFDSNNNLNLFMYSSRENDSQQIWHSVSADQGETWNDWTKVSDGLGDSRHASATLMGSKILTAWRSEFNSKSQIYFSIYSENNWSKPELVMQNDNYQFFPVVGTNKNNDVAVTWMENSDNSEFPRDDPENSKGYFAAYDKSTNKFKDKILIGENIYYPHLPVKNLYDNNFYVAYEEGQNKNFEIRLLTIN